MIYRIKTYTSHTHNFIVRLLRERGAQTHDEVPYTESLYGNIDVNSNVETLNELRDLEQSNTEFAFTIEHGTDRS